jgi:hypothetical protein
MDRFLAIAVFTVFAAAGVVVLVWLYTALAHTVREQPLWISAPVVVSLIVVAFGYAALVDSLRSRKLRQRPWQ